ncbi:MAG: hypothetical protein RJA22_240 [Verrucomicrobiota bacterium]
MASAAPAAATFKVGEFTFQTPAGWESVKDISPMRKAQLKVPGDGKGGGEVVFFHFGPGGGGGTQANIERWLGQFEETRDKLNAKTEETKVKGRKVTYVQAEGTYLSGMPGGPKTPQPGTMLMGAIMESEEGSVFIRFTGPAALGRASLAPFRKMVEGAAPAAR